MQQAPMFEDIDGVDAITDEAINFLLEHLSGKGELFVAFSGGKDSICTAELMRLSGLPHRLFYSFTGIDPPEVVRFIRRHYPGCNFLRPKKTFWKDLAKNIPPGDVIRWCCTSLKKEPGWRLPHVFRVQGIRSEEGTRRSNYGRTNHFMNSETDHWQYYPVYHWRAWQVWDFIDANRLPYPALYDEGFERIGCVICPYHSERTGKIHQRYRDRWPRYFDLYEKTVAALYRKRVSQGKNMAYPTPEAFLAAWYRNKAARWYAE